MPPKVKRVYSDKPSAVRRRVRKNSKNIERDVEKLYRKPMEQWDMEELARGRPRNRAGNFQGPVPRWITPLILKEAQERLRTRTRQELGVYAEDALKVMHGVMMSQDSDDNGRPIVAASVKVQAAQYLLDQTIGKPTQQVEVQGNVVLETMLAKILVNEDGSPAHPILDAEVLEDDDDTEEEVLDDDEE